MEQIQYINFKGKFVNISKSFVKSYISSDILQRVSYLFTMSLVLF